MEPDTNSSSKDQRATQLAAVRTALALDRTLLALVRTSLTLIAFGFTLARVVHDMVIKGVLPGFPSASPRQMGLILIGLGVLTVIGAAIENVRLRKMLEVHTTKSVYSVSLMVTCVIALLGLSLMVSLLLEFVKT